MMWARQLRLQLRRKGLHHLAIRRQMRIKTYGTCSVKKRFNVDSPSFTPASLAVNGNQATPKSTGISPKFANAAPFKPKGIVSRPASTAPSNTSSTRPYNPNAPEWNVPDTQEFLPQTYNGATPHYFHSSNSPVLSGLKMSAHRRVPVRSTQMDDPFFLDLSLPTPAKSSEDRAGSSKHADHAATTSPPSYLTIFGNAPIYSRPSSAIELPSSPSSRRDPVRQKSPGLSPGPPRNSNIFLNAGATPFRPKDAPIYDFESNQQRARLPFLAQEVPSEKESPLPDVKQSQMQSRHDKKNHQNTSIPRESLGPSISPVSTEKIRLYLRNARCSTPTETSQHGSFAAKRRNLAHSDEPRFYQYPTVSRHVSSPSPAGKLWMGNPALQHGPRLGTMDGSSTLHTQHPFNLHASLSMPRLPVHQSRTLHFDQAYRTNSDHNRENRMLNYLDQGPFQGSENGDPSQTSLFDHYAPTPSIPPQNHTTTQPQINPYSQDGNTISSGAYFPGSTNYPQQLQHHLYAALPTHRDLKQANQRTAKDFFIPEDLRQNLTRKAEASLMTMPNSSLPHAIAHYHSLVPLVHNNQKNTTLFGYQSQAYKATSGHDGKMYCLRRLQGYRLSEVSSENAIRNVQQKWKRVRNGNVVTVHLAFTNSSFGDSSLIFVTDFHPLAETLAQKHFPPASRFTTRFGTAQIPEQTLWGYIVQMANALKAIHSAGLAARVIDPSKILLTGENRIRLNACAIVDVVQADTQHSLVDYQRLDLYLLGKLILTLGSNNTFQHSQGKAMDVLTKVYTLRLQEVTNWLLDHISPHRTDNIDDLLTQIAGDMITAFDNSLHQNDALESVLAHELENSRLVRLMTKMNMINERPEYEHDRQWAEHGSRYCIRLFRDYVFHQVDAQGNPVLDLGHVLACLNKLDVGIEERVMLMTRDEENVVVVTYKELKG
ncbi:MAG: hypothetical protein Q9170_007580, partial [Blastenia crenularia]